MTLPRKRVMTIWKSILLDNATPLQADAVPDGNAALNDAHAEIDRLSAKLVQAEKALQDLSHEMKTPLNAVIGFADTMKTETFGPIGSAKYLEYANHISASGDHLLNLVTTILDLAKLDTGKATLEPVYTDPVIAARQCFDMVSKASEDIDISFSFSAEPGVPHAWIDPKALRQILINLLANAAKFTSDGGIEMHVAATASNIVFTIEDTGIGMSKSHLAAIGARFSDAQAKGVRGAGGTGLGLSLAVELADLHEGSVDLESAPGEGVKATVTLPIGKAFQRDCPAGDKNFVQSQLDRIDLYRKERKLARQSAA